MKKQALEKLELEYFINSSPRILFFFLSAPTGFTGWFCDDISVKDNIYTFYWDGESRSAELLAIKLNKVTQFRWLDMPKDTYFEFKLEIEDLTNAVALIITDFEPADEVRNSRLLWDSQVNKLIQCVGG